MSSNHESGYVVRPVRRSISCAALSLAVVSVFWASSATSEGFGVDPLMMAQRQYFSTNTGFKAREAYENIWDFKTEDRELRPFVIPGCRLNPHHTVTFYDKDSPSIPGLHIYTLKDPVTGRYQTKGCFPRRKAKHTSYKTSAGATPPGSFLLHPNYRSKPYAHERRWGIAININRLPGGPFFELVNGSPGRSYESDLMRSNESGVFKIPRDHPLLTPKLRGSPKTISGEDRMIAASQLFFEQLALRDPNESYRGPGAAFSGVTNGKQLEYLVRMSRTSGPFDKHVDFVRVGDESVLGRGSFAWHSQSKPILSKSGGQCNISASDQRIIVSSYENGGNSGPSFMGGSAHGCDVTPDPCLTEVNLAYFQGLRERNQAARGSRNDYLNPQRREQSKSVIESFMGTSRFSTVEDRWGADHPSKASSMDDKKIRDPGNMRATTVLVSSIDFDDQNNPIVVPYHRSASVNVCQELNKIMPGPSPAALFEEPASSSPVSGGHKEDVARAAPAPRVQDPVQAPEAARVNSMLDSPSIDAIRELRNEYAKSERLESLGKIFPEEVGSSAQAQRTEAQRRFDQNLKDLLAYPGGKEALEHYMMMMGSGTDETQRDDAWGTYQAGYGLLQALAYMNPDWVRERRMNPLEAFSEATGALMRRRGVLNKGLQSRVPTWLEQTDRYKGFKAQAPSASKPSSAQPSGVQGLLPLIDDPGLDGL